jgi:hypothetical protein
MHLTAQLAAAALLMVVMTLVHALGVLGIARGLRLDRRREPGGRLRPGTVAILGAVALLLFGLHMAEIGLFAAFYLAIGAFADLEEALFASAASYATLAQPENGFPLEWRLVGAIEGLVGFLLIGWSTAFFVTDMNKLLRE